LRDLQEFNLIPLAISIAYPDFGSELEQEGREVSELNSLDESIFSTSTTLLERRQAIMMKRDLDYTSTQKEIAGFVRKLSAKYDRKYMLSKIEVARHAIGGE